MDDLIRPLYPQIEQTSANNSWSYTRKVFHLMTGLLDELRSRWRHCCCSLSPTSRLPSQDQAVLNVHTKFSGAVLETILSSVKEKPRPERISLLDPVEKVLSSSCCPSGHVGRPVAGWEAQAGLDVSVLPSLAKAEKSCNAVSSFVIGGCKAVAVCWNKDELSLLLNTTLYIIYSFLTNKIIHCVIHYSMVELMQFITCQTSVVSFPTENLFPDL